MKNILIIKPSALGDVALSLPAVASIRKSFPDAKITWLVRKEFAPLLSMTENVDEILLFDRKKLGKWYLSPKVFRELLSFFGELRKPKFDLVIDLQGLFRTAFFGWVTGSKKRFGMKPSREFAGIFYNNRVEFDEQCIHLIDYHNKIISAAGASEIVYDYGLHPDAESLAQADSLLEENGLDGRCFTVFVMGAAHHRKCWPVEYFAELAKRIQENHDMAIVAVGTGQERPLIEKLKSLVESDIVDLAGKTSIPVLASVMKKASMVVSNDTGPGHIAEAVGSKMVMIFGPTNPARIFPYQKPGSVAAIYPFGRGAEISSSNDEYTIEKVSVENVYQRVSSLLCGE